MSLRIVIAAVLSSQTVVGPSRSKPNSPRSLRITTIDGDESASAISSASVELCATRCCLLDFHANTDWPINLQTAGCQSAATPKGQNPFSPARKPFPFPAPKIHFHLSPGPHFLAPHHSRPGTSSMSASSCRHARARADVRGRTVAPSQLVSGTRRRHGRHAHTRCGTWRASYRTSPVSLALWWTSRW